MVERDAAWRRAMWDAIGRGLTAHVVMLRDTAIIDDALAGSLLTAIDGVWRGAPAEDGGSLELVAAFDERVDSLSAAGVSGAGRIARSRHDLAATAQRLVLRDRALKLAEALQTARGALLDLAEEHVFTLMPAWSGNALLQPTNLAHFLTGAIAPLGRAAHKLQSAYDDLDRSPLGAGALAGPGLPVDRDQTADLLGSEGPVGSTFDALSAVDHFETLSAVAAASVAPAERLLRELLLWVRTEPNAFRLREELLAPVDPNLPHFRPTSALERLRSEAQGIQVDAQTVASISHGIGYGPVGDMADSAARIAAETLSSAARVAESFAAIISGSIEFNRAWLARNAGRGMVTVGDLADFLMAEEGLDPVAAREISSLTAIRTLQDGLEASAITPERIDAAALLVIGRELGIEIERLGAYLAPRRFIEKRTVLGGPAAPAVREYLQTERDRLAADARWLENTRRRIALAEENLDIRVREVLEAASG